MNKGFTLIETLTAIVLMSMIMIVAIPSYTGVSEVIKTTNYNSKILAIESATLKFANQYLVDEVKTEGCNPCWKTYDLYDFIVKHGIYSPETYDEEQGPSIINPINGERLEGEVYVSFDMETLSLKAEFILGGMGSWDY